MLKSTDPMFCSMPVCTLRRSIGTASDKRKRAMVSAAERRKAPLFVSDPQISIELRACLPWFTTHTHTTTITAGVRCDYVY